MTAPETPRPLGARLGDWATPKVMDAAPWLPERVFVTALWVVHVAAATLSWKAVRQLFYDMNDFADEWAGTRIEPGSKLPWRRGGGS